MPDSLALGRRFRGLNIVDDYRRESVRIEGDTSLGGQGVARVLDPLRPQRGWPNRMVLDNSPECSRPGMDLWAYPNGLPIDFSRPGKPTDHALIESFHGTFRQECLKAPWFPTLWAAQQIVEGWRREYHESRPPRAWGEKTPYEFALQIAARCDLQGLETAQNSHHE